MIEVPPSQAAYCTEVIIGTTFCPEHRLPCRREDCQRKYGTDTSDLFLYTADRPTAREITERLPVGWYKIEVHTRLTPQGRERENKGA